MKKTLPLLALIFAAAALVACGGSDSGTSTTSTSGGTAPTSNGGGGGGGGGSAVKLSADPSGALSFDTSSLSAKAGNVTIDFDNPAAISHDVAVEDSGGKELGKSDLVAQGKTTLDLSNLKPGTYTYFCTVPGHREGGMEGTLTVK
jgi:plastocyanin